MMLGKAVSRGWAGRAADRVKQSGINNGFTFMSSLIFRGLQVAALHPLDDHRDALAAADAHGHQAVAAAGAFEFVHRFYQ